MNDVSDLRQKIFAHDNASREIVVAYIKALSSQAKQLPVTERTDIAADILGCLLRQDWIDHDSSDDLEEITEIATSLDINGSDERLWQELFGKIDHLQ